MYKQNRNSENNFLDEILVYGRQTQSNEDKRDSDNSLILAITIEINNFLLCVYVVYCDYIIAIHRLLPCLFFSFPPRNLIRLRIYFPYLYGK
jgi:hypothetical protein